MKRISILSVAFAAFFAVSGCAESTCDHYSKTVDGLLAKKCPDMGLEASQWPTCEQALSDGSCTAADFSNLEKQLDCIDQVAACTPGQEQSWYDTVSRCSVHLDAVSTSCRQALLKR